MRFFASKRLPPVDSIEEVNVATNSYDAEQGMAGGSAAINVHIKSGTNSYHGEAYEFHNDQYLRALNRFNPVGFVKPRDILNQFGGNVGGSIKKNKVFFFGDWERTVRRQFAAKSASVPNPAALFDSSGNVSFVAMEIISMTGDGTGTLTVNGTNANDAITQTGNNITVNNGAAVVFTAYPTLTLNGLNGDDTVSVQPSGLVGVRP